MLYDFHGIITKLMSFGVSNECVKPEADKYIVISKANVSSAIYP